MTVTNEEIYVMGVNGDNQTRLTNNAARDWYPSYSPDGTKIAFTSNRDGANSIWVMGADGSNPTRLTSSQLIGGTCGPRSLPTAH